MNSKLLLLIPVLMVILAPGFSVTGYFQFDKMNGTVLSIDNAGVPNVLVRLNCSVEGDTINIKTFNTTTNSSGRYSFAGQGAYFSDNFGRTLVTCILSSNDTRVVNNNPPFVFRIISGYYSLGATYNLTHNSLATAPVISLIYPLVTVGSSDTVIIAMNYSQSCFINNLPTTRIGTSNQFQRTMDFNNGVNYLSARCVDVTGINRTLINIPITGDTVGPLISLVSPTSIVGVNNPTLVISATDASSVSSCTVNSLPMGDVGGGQFSRPLTGLSNGANNLNVICEDSFGNSGEQTVTINADLLAPVIAINSPLNTTYASGIVRVNLTVTDDTLQNIWYNWNGTDYFYTAPVDINFGSGARVLNVYANDSFSRLSHQSVAFTVSPIVDTQAPNLAIINPVNTTYATQNINLIISATDNVLLDQVWYNYNGANITYAGLLTVTFNEGFNFLQAWANDSSGNTNYTSVHFTVTLDSQAPLLNIINPLNTTYDYQNIFLNLSAIDPNLDSIWYNYDGTNISYSNDLHILFDNGEYFLQAWANDTYGNTNYSSVYFTVDSVTDEDAPLLNIISPLNTTYDYQNILLNLSAIDPNLESIWYNWEGINVTYTDLTSITFNEGVNVLHAWANDTYGNTNYSSVTFTVSPIIDTEAPNLEIISPLNTTYDYQNILLNLSAIDPNLESIWYNWNGTDYFYINPITIMFNEGINVLHAWANDTFGNTNYSSVTFTIDSVAPELEILSPLNNTYNNRSILLDLWAYDLNLAQIWYNWNGVNITYTHPIIIFFNEGFNWLQAWAIDLFGNLNYTSVYFTVDSQVPTIDIIIPLDGTIYENEILELRVQTDMAVESCWFNQSSVLNTTMIRQSSTNYYYPISLEDGDYYYTFYCNTSSSAVGSNSTSFTVLVDSEAPLEIAINSPLTSYYNHYPEFNVTVNKLVDNCTYSLNGAANITMDALSLNSYGAIGFGFIEESVNNIVYYCETPEELASNSAIFYIDTIPPRVSFEQISIINQTPFNLTGSFYDPSGIHSVTYYYNGIEIGENNFEPFNYLWDVPLSVENSYINLSLIAFDTALNINSSYLLNVPVNVINDAPIAILEFDGSYSPSVKLLNATASYNPDYEFDGIEVNLTYQLSPDNVTYYNINDSSCTNVTTVCEWNILETVGICPFDAACYLRAMVNDDLHFVSSNVVAFYDNAPKDLTILSMMLPNEPIVNNNYNVSFDVLNKGSFDVFFAVANYYDNGELFYSKSFDISPDEQITLVFEDVNFTKGVHNITIGLDVINEITPVDNSLTAFVTSEYFVEKMLISAMAPDRVMNGSRIDATIFAYNPLSDNFTLDNYPHSDFAAAFSPLNYVGGDLDTASLIYFSYNFNVPETAGIFNFWANSSLQEEGIEISSNIEEINVTEPNSPILSVDLITMPKISNLWNSLVIAQVYNYGNETALDVNATIVLPSGVNLILPDEKIEIGSIDNGTYRQINWTVRGDYAGDFDIGIIVESSNHELIGKNVELQKPILAHSLSYDSVIDTTENLTLTVFINNTGANANNVNVSLILSDNLSSTELFRVVNLPNNTLNYEVEFNVSCSLATINNKTFKVAVREVSSNYYQERVVSFTKRVDPVLHTIVTLSASASGNNAILNWNAVSEAIRYLVYKSSSSSGPFINIANTTANNYQDSAVAYDVTHYYRVVAMNAKAQLGMNSNVASILIPTPITPPPYVPPSGGGGSGGFFPPSNGGGALPEDNATTNQTGKNDTQVVVNDVLLAQRVNNLTKALGVIEEFRDLLTMEQKLSVELIKNELLKAELNASNNQTHYLSALNSFKLYFDKYEVINETINSSSMLENLRIDSTMNKVRVKLSSDSEVYRYAIIRNATNDGDEEAKNLLISFDLPEESIIKSSDKMSFEGSKALMKIESLNPGETITAEYSFITKNDYAEYMALAESAPMAVNPLTGLITLLESNANIVIYSTAGLAIVILGLFAYIKRAMLGSALIKISRKANDKKVEMLNRIVRKLNRNIKKSEKKK